MKKKKDKVVVMDMMAASFYNQIDPRYKQGMADSSMIQEGRDSIANLSEKEINRFFNANRFVEKLSDGC